MTDGISTITPDGPGFRLGYAPRRKGGENAPYPFTSCFSETFAGLPLAPAMRT
jgi:hypothetical protein